MSHVGHYLDHRGVFCFCFEYFVVFSFGDNIHKVVVVMGYFRRHVFLGDGTDSIGYVIWNWQLVS